MNTSQKLEIKVFGDEVKQITEYQTFVATLESVEGHAVATLHPLEYANWYDKRENLMNLAAYLVDKDGEIDTVYFLEKPWKWELEWNSYQESIS